MPTAETEMAGDSKCRHLKLRWLVNFNLAMPTAEADVAGERRPLKLGRLAPDSAFTCIHWTAVRQVLGHC